MSKVKLRVINLRRDKLSIHPAIVSKHEAFNNYKPEFKTEAFSKAFITTAVEVSPVNVVQGPTGEYFCITGQCWLESLYRLDIQKISVILYEDIDNDEIELLYAASLLSSYCFMKDRHVFLAVLAEQIQQLPVPIRRILFAQSYSCSGSKIIENITGETRSAMDHQKKNLHSKQDNEISSTSNSLDLLIKGDC